MTTHKAEIAIVGGGVHGVHLAVRLLEADVVAHDRLRIVEPEGLLSAFEEKCRQCGMTELRSPIVHHVGVDPFSLLEFARARGREDEVVPSDVGAERPTTGLFFDHADKVIERYDLESTVIEDRVCGLVERADGVDLETTAGTLSSRACVLAIGHGRSYTRPEWAVDLPPEASVTHVWNAAFDPDEIGETARVGIVGGGITAAQLATTLARPERDVTVFARSPFRVETLEASREWMHFSGAVNDLQALPPASRARHRLVADARRDGTMPPHVFSRLRRTIDREWVDLERSEIAAVTPAGGTVVVTCQDGTATWFDDLVLATGFDSPYDAPLFTRIREDTDLQTGYRGAPALEDDTLRWRRSDGTPSRVAVSGIAAQGTLGPFARNVIGARRAGELLVDTLETLESPLRPA
ncbi:FAD/NAD(P)-binding protein [Natrialbaceae archaeon A-gly3]